MPPCCDQPEYISCQPLTLIERQPEGKGGAVGEVGVGAEGERVGLLNLRRVGCCSSVQYAASPSSSCTMHCRCTAEEKVGLASQIFSPNMDSLKTQICNMFKIIQKKILDKYEQHDNMKLLM